jgi:hypothetical protein
VSVRARDHEEDTDQVGGTFSRSEPPQKPWLSELPGPGSAAGYHPSVDVLPLVLMLAGDGRTLEDLRVLRGDEGGLRSLSSPE